MRVSAQDVGTPDKSRLYTVTRCSDGAAGF